MKRFSLVLFLFAWLAAWTPARAESSLPAQAAGRLEPRRYAELSLPNAGRVEQVLVTEGEHISAGQLIARLDGYETRQSELDQAELELVLAQQALDELQRTAATQLAEVELESAQLRRQRDLAQSRVASLERARPPWHLEAAKANLLLAERSLAKAQEDLDRARHFYADRDDFAWLFINRGPYRLYLAVLEKKLTRAEQRSRDARQKVEDLQAPVDEIDLQQARAELALLQARLGRATDKHHDLSNGPDPDDLEAAQARLSASQDRVSAAQTALSETEIRSPLAGVVVELDIKPGEWALSGQRLAAVADLGDWVAVMDELSEEQAVMLTTGQPVSLSLDAYPGVELAGRVESVSDYPREEEGQVYYQARIGLEQPDVPLLWGMTARLLR